MTCGIAEVEVGQLLYKKLGILPALAVEDFQNNFRCVLKASLVAFEPRGKEGFDFSRSSQSPSRENSSTNPEQVMRSPVQLDLSRHTDQ
jgi:hypothetical protein